jgi:hypothetical protein
VAYRTGFIFLRCFLQKAVTIRPGITAKPLGRTGLVGEINNLRKLLAAAGSGLSRENLDAVVSQHEGRGAATLVEFEAVEADNHEAAIAASIVESSRVASGLAIVSSNPAILACAFASSPRDWGVQFFLPQDRVIRHGTRLDDGTPVHGYLDALPALAAAEAPKVRTLLRLYQASVRETEPDFQMLFQLVLLDEASDGEHGGSLGERMRGLCSRLLVIDDLNKVPERLGFALPPGKDMVDALVKLRNAAAHDGEISENSLRNFNGDWLLPVLGNKAALHRLVDESVRLVLCSFVGHGLGVHSTRLTATHDNHEFRILCD